MVRLWRAKEPDCVLLSPPGLAASKSAGSSEVGAARIATCSPPPYCGRVSALAAKAPIITLLSTNNRQSKSFISPCFSISRYCNCRFALRFGPQRHDAAREIDSGAYGHRITVGKLIGAHRSARLLSGT